MTRQSLADPNASAKLEEHLKVVEEWLATWRIRVNEQKCKHNNIANLTEETVQL